jgi:hypothetical protein
MKRLLPVFLLLALAACAAPASAAPLFHSANVTEVTSLPEAAGAASARFSPDGKTMYVSTWKGLHIYDITKPDDPRRIGVLPLPHFENEDVEAGDGVVIITNDPSEGMGLIYIVDVRDPATPTIRAIIRNGDIVGASDAVLGDTTSNTGHIANCLQGCKWLWTTGTSEGISIFDLRDLDHPKFVKQMAMPKGKGKDSPGFTHDVFVDRSGIAWVTGQDGTFGFDSSDPTNPKLVYRSDENVTNSGNDGPSSPDTANSYPLDFLHHNSIRTDIQLAPKTVEQQEAARQAPAAASSSAPATQPAAPAARRGPTRAQLLAKMKRSIKACRSKHGKRARAACEKRARAAFRKADARRRAARTRFVGRAGARTTLGGLGDVMAITEEDYARPGCNGQGSIQTWQILPGEHNSDGSTKLKMLDMWTTELNELDQQTGRSPGTVLCSAHWFDEDRGLLAQGWYDQGVRFMDISNPRDIRQVGYWVTTGTFWGAYYAPTDPTRQTVYALDIQNGIDVLHIDRGKSASTMRSVRAPIASSWLKPGARKLRASPTWGFACPLL